MIRQFRDDVVVERVGNEYVILSGADGVAHRLSSLSQQAVDALLLGHDVSGFKADMSLLDRLGLLKADSRGLVSRRQAVAGIAGIAGASAAALALPTAAFASSETFFVNNTAFGWFPQITAGEPEVFVINPVPLDPSIFSAGQSWTITVDTGGGILTASATVTGSISDPASLSFEFPGAVLADGVNLVLLGRLTGPGGARSNQFQISELVD
jgi:hypothetical protein